MISANLIQRIFILFGLVGLFGVNLSSAQVGAKCSDRVAELYPRQQLDLQRMEGEWYILEVARPGATPLPVTCMSQVLRNQNNSENENMDIQVKYNVTTPEGGLYFERDGQVNVTSDSGIWRWSYFDNPAQYWDGVVIATDYENYWVHYECEEIGDLRSENAVVRYRTRTFLPDHQSIFQSLMEGLGFEKSEFAQVPQIDCGGDVSI